MLFKKLSYAVLIMLFSISVPLHAGELVLGFNLEFIDADFNKDSFDGGLGIQAGYEFKKTENWDIGVLVEMMSGLNDETDLDTAGDMMYESKSLFITARPLDWPLTLKAGIVDADYKILLQDFTQNYREVNDLGYAYGLTLSFGGKGVFRLNILDIKKVKIGADTFTTVGITLAIFGH